ncbi:MAG: hypothetical protein JNIBNLAF_00041 [Nitrosomonas europaea]|uniref:DUF4468 domain-containing protein n=1 Tax=Nitrosomonas TaxID=914 RepID=UPI0023F17EB3|nr:MULTISPECIES: DUF4468 domain-containing protein [Nitrosomonas]MBV6388449.1 hypothetical protein [Nitrosomonas europaea]
MKLLISLVAAVVLTGCVATEPIKAIKEEDRTFSAVYDVPGSQKSEIYEGTKQWIAQNFQSAKRVIEYDNPSEGILIGNGIIKYSCEGMECLAKANWTFPFTMKVEVKDERFRLTFSNIHLAWPASPSGPAANFPINQQQQLDTAKPKLLAFGEQIKSALASGKASSNW